MPWRVGSAYHVGAVAITQAPTMTRQAQCKHGPGPNQDMYHNAYYHHQSNCPCPCDVHDTEPLEWPEGWTLNEYTGDTVIFELDMVGGFVQAEFTKEGLERLISTAEDMHWRWEGLVNRDEV